MSSRKHAQSPSKRSLAALLRFVAAAEGGIALSGSDPVCLTAQGGRTATVGRSVVEQALRLGLVTMHDGLLRPSSETLSYLRRLVSVQDGFQEQHRDLAERSVETATGRQTVSINQQESPLGVISRMKDKAGTAYVPESAIAAGERFARDFVRAGLQPRLTMAWEPRLSSRTPGDQAGARDISDTAVAARQRVQRAIEAMGPELSGVALDVCCFQKGLETVERERQWPARSAKLMLRAALLALARHYDPARPQSQRGHHWGAEGYRPDMAASFGGDPG